MLIVRFDAAIYFANSQYLKDKLQAYEAQAQVQSVLVSHLVLAPQAATCGGCRLCKHVVLSMNWS